MISHTKSYIIMHLQYEVNTNLFSMTNSKLGLPVVSSDLQEIVVCLNQGRLAGFEQRACERKAFRKNNVLHGKFVSE